MRVRHSGFTPLHCATNYGSFETALLLLRHGADPEVVDCEMKTPNQRCCPPWCLEDRTERKVMNEIFVWGTNRNYNLGLEDKEGKEKLHILDFFARQSINIMQAAMSCYHCLFLDSGGDLYSVGLGDGGRLGTNSESTLVLPKKLQIPSRRKGEKVEKIYAAKNHSVIETSEHRVSIKQSLSGRGILIQIISTGIHMWIECPSPVGSQSEYGEIVGLPGGGFWVR